MTVNGSKTILIVGICPSLTLQHGSIKYTIPLSPYYRNTRQWNGIGAAPYTVTPLACLSCNYGYSLSGPREKTCQSSGEWNGEPTTCTLSNEPIQLKYN